MGHRNERWQPETFTTASLTVERAVTDDIDASFLSLNVSGLFGAGYSKVDPFFVLHKRNELGLSLSPSVVTCKQLADDIAIAALVGEDDLAAPPCVTNSPKSRFRNGHASFRLRMLQEQHGTGFEPREREECVGIRNATLNVQLLDNTRKEKSSTNVWFSSADVASL
ncbi:hypothetical protein OESDEN_00269 [Oesophagostomum dentatum]|uniref:Uncharacterized protein n=1 Tax=Oesophagostomum dentatum TaxID=61180 RepID=A0A0B1TWD3_OESDE|nr:hypothetical protein OESDEN_00269 [Oesophagostomum dentatum]